jgi:hypothetical protein
MSRVASFTLQHLEHGAHDARKGVVERNVDHKKISLDSIGYMTIHRFHFGFRRAAATFRKTSWSFRPLPPVIEPMQILGGLAAPR